MSVVVVVVLLIIIVLVFVLAFCFFGDSHEPNPQPNRSHLPFSASERKLAAKYAHETNFLIRKRPHNQTAKIFTRKWFPQSEAKAIVVMCHGLSDHSGRTVKIVEKLLENNFAVFASDYEGFGRSSGRHGYFLDFDILVQDNLTLLQEIRKETQPTPIYLLGGSMGGLMIISTVLAGGNKLIAGAVIQAPSLEVHKDCYPPKIIELIARGIVKFAPKLPIAKGNIGKNSSPSVSQQNEALKLEDPLFYSGYLRIGTGLAMQMAMLKVASKHKEFDVPYLLQHGCSDQVCSPEGSEKFHKNTSSVDKEYIKYASGAHDLFNEPPVISNAVTDDLIQWLNDRLKQ